MIPGFEQRYIIEGDGAEMRLVECDDIDIESADGDHDWVGFTLTELERVWAQIKTLEAARVLRLIAEKKVKT